MKLNINGHLRLLSSLVILLLPGCSTCDKDNCVVPPDPFKFRIIDRNSTEDLIFSVIPRYHPDSIRLFYLQDEEEIDLPVQITTSEYYRGVLINQALPYISAVEFIKDYYLQLNYNDTDTLLIDVRLIDFECCTVFEWAESYINGEKLRRSPNDFSVFLIEK
jgi:hypothetical protein